MKMDETLYGIAEKVKNFAVIYLVNTQIFIRSFIKFGVKKLLTLMSIFFLG
jgi:hypothetical protein